MTGDVRSHAGRAQQPSLLDAWQRYLARQEAAKAAADDGGEDTEAHALRKSRKRLARHLRDGEHPARATAMAFQRYRELGGKSQFAVWTRRAASG